MSFFYKNLVSVSWPVAWPLTMALRALRSENLVVIARPGAQSSVSSGSDEVDGVASRLGRYLSLCPSVV